MGRVKSALIKRTVRQLLEHSPETYTEKFDDNKKILGDVMPSKKVRNIMAGYITRLKRAHSKQLA